MIPQAFDYERPGTVADAIGLLGKHGDGARVLAGGHSLLPMMKLRLAAPDALIDISGIPGLSGIREEGGGLAIGALTTHAEVAGSDLVRSICPILAEAAAGVGDTQVRNRGTIGGSLANADPHGDMPAVVLALEAEVTAEGAGGTRTIAARDLFVDYMTCCLHPDEILTEVRVPAAAHGAYVKFNRRSQDWAVVGVAAVVDGSSARIALTGVGPRPVRAVAAERAFTGANAAAAAELASDGLDPPTDTASSSEYRKHLARVLTRRALDTAAGR
jgi:aerobic carbon-monoxide dehydrogenase medium subunit